MVVLEWLVACSSNGDLVFACFVPVRVSAAATVSGR